MPLKIALTGANGQLGRTLQHSALSRDHELIALDRTALDISDESAVRRTLDELRPDVLINAAAYTAVDRAENDEEAARAANADGAKNLARWAAASDAWLLQVSTDFVFNGRAGRPYTPDDQPDPINLYGRSKLEGELHVRYLAPDNSLILRTGWVYSQYGGNFLSTMLRLMASKEALTVVDDQIGTPSSTDGLVQCIEAAVERRPTGILHWSDAGVASWYDFAVAIQDEALRYGLLERRIPVTPIPASEYPTPARRPAFSVLDKSATRAVLGIDPKHWRRRLVGVLQAVQQQ
ncbi:MAG: dTDP-4-dehydrorhamnose reductase [Pseudohongiellaceae bacterium]